MTAHPVFPAVLALLAASSAVAQPASNIDLSDTRSLQAPALPLPPLALSAPPRAYLLDARREVLARHDGASQEALERAETRLLDRPDAGIMAGVAISVGSVAQASRLLDRARHALAARDRAGALRAIDDALALPGLEDAVPAPGVFAAAPAAPLDGASGVAAVPPGAELLPIVPTQTFALLPGHWALHGADWVWVPPDERLRPVLDQALVPGRFVWHEGAYGWVPAHYLAP